MPENNNMMKNADSENRLPFMCPYMYKNTYQCQADERGWQFGCPYCPFFAGRLGGFYPPYPYARGGYDNVPFPESQQ